jgi:hypothetical protein
LPYEDFKFTVTEVWENEKTPDARPVEKPKESFETEETAKSAVMVQGVQEESEKTEPEKARPNTRRKYAGRPGVRRGPQRGRRRRPGYVTKKVEGESVDNVPSETKSEANLGNTSISTDISGDIKSPMPPLPRPFVRENLNAEPPMSKDPTPPPADGAGD